MKTPLKRPVALILLDGWGCSPSIAGNAIALAYTPNYDAILQTSRSTRLAASGTAVGLPEGSPGNAEIGHVNIGAGRIVKTDAARISDAIRSGEFDSNPQLTSALSLAAAQGKPVHLIGLLGDGGVNSSSATLYALLRMAKRHGVSEAYVHGILDGRDVPPRTADIYVEALEIKMADIGLGKIATLCGRFFAMDNGENWERTARAFTMLFHAEGERQGDAVNAVRSSFLRGISDEFIAPIVLEGIPGKPVATIREGDTVIFFNHRADTSRQLVRSLAVPEPGQLLPVKPQIETVCLTEYDRSFDLPVAFPPESRDNNLAEVLAQQEIHNYRITEADRFAHITTFLNGGAEFAGLNEMHIQVPAAPRPSDRESEPEMRSFKITDSFIRAIDGDPTGLFIVNIPAPGMVAETGNLDRTVEAVQYVDTCLGGMIAKVKEFNGIAVITSTHGNCESMVLPTSEPDRYSTTNSVPLHLIGDNVESRLRSDGSLCDVAPTLLGLLGVEKPTSMTGTDLRI